LLNKWIPAIFIGKPENCDGHPKVLFCFTTVFVSKVYTALLFCSENEAASTLSSLVDMPHQTRLVELLIASPEVRNKKDTNANC